MTTVEPIRDLTSLKKVEAILTKQSLRNVLFFSLGTNCGLRISDIVSLNVVDVRDKNFIEIIEKKTGKYKKFPINAKLLSMIKIYVKNKRGKQPLFLSKHKKRLDRYGAYRIIKAACKKAKIEEKVGTHTLRKTFGYHHYQKFKDVAMLQKIFNHSSPEITLRYIGIEQEQIYESYVNFVL